jgi:hypothetical protein
MARSAQEAVNTYYESWRRGGRFCPSVFSIPFLFNGPFNRYDHPLDFIAMAEQLGRTIRDIEIVKQFIDGDHVCSIVNLVTTVQRSVIPCAEWIQLKEGRIAVISVFTDARRLAGFIGRSSAKP